MTRRQWIQTTAAASLAGAQAARPNVVVFLADDLGFRDVSYQESEIQTPNIDRLAKGGLRLNRFHSFPVCSPTRAGLMTGRHPVRYGLCYSVVRPWANYGLSTAEKTMGNAFQDAGYQTAVIGKWHLGHTHAKLLPQSRGFDHFYGHVNGAIDYFSHTRGAAVDWQRNGETVQEKGYTTDLLAAEAARWVRARDRSRPFFLYVPWNAPHTPLQAPEDLIQKYSAIADRRRRTFAAMVDAMDRGIGEVVRALEQENLLGNTLILFFSDNGGPRRQGADNGALREGKGTVFEGGLRVPAVLHWPGRIPPGESDQVATVMDVLPTLAAAAGVPLQAAAPLDGANLWPQLSAGKTVARDELFFAVQSEGGPKQHALRLGDWKLVRMEAQGEKPAEEFLFHIASDPEEKKNLLAQEAGRAADLRQRLRKWVALHPPSEVITSGDPHPGWVEPSDWSRAAVR